MPPHNTTKRRAGVDRPALPPVGAKLRTSVLDYLQTTYSPYRPPEISATLLALIIEMAKRNQPFPVREYIAEHLGCSKFTIDNAISTALARGLIEEKWGTESSTEMANRIIRLRFYIPTATFLSALSVKL